MIRSTPEYVSSFADAAVEAPMSRPLPLLSWSGLSALASAVLQRSGKDKYSQQTALLLVAPILRSQAVMISHDNIIFETNCVIKCLEPHDFGLEEDQCTLRAR
eukprot:5532720-Amphidinium_carterae.1